MREKILRTSQVCKRLDISQTTFWRWRKAGHFPEPRGLPGSTIRGWTKSTVDEWILRNFGITPEEE